MHAAPVDVAVLEHIGVVGGVLLGPRAQGEGRGIFQQFQTAARHREWCAAGLADNAFTVVHQARHAGVFAGGLAHRIVKTEIPVRGVHRHFVSARVQFEQGFLPVGQRVAILLHVLRGDHKQRLFVGVRVYRMVAGALEIHVGRYPQPLTAEGRNAAISITGLLRAHARQVSA